MPFGATPLDRIDASAVDQWRTKRLAAEASKATINRDAGALSSAIACVRSGSDRATSARAPQAAEDRSEGAYPIPERRRGAAVLVALEAPDPMRPAYLRPVVMLMLYAGLRRGGSAGASDVRCGS